MIASELKIYKDAFALTSYIMDIQPFLPRMYRYTIGQKMANTSLEMFEYIQLANMYKESRAKHLVGFTVKFELLKTLIRLCSEKRLISIKQQADIARRTIIIGKQLTAWRSAATSHSSRGA